VTSGLRVLITTHWLCERAGSELFVRDLALGLIRRGHSPVAYSSALGVVADELRRSTIPVIDDLASLGDPPDVIHGQHHVDAMAAVLRFPDVPALFMCHGWKPWEEEPPRFPSIRRYVAVDDVCRDRVIDTAGVPADRVRTIYNAVDLARFAPRPPLPRRPCSALVFSNAASEATFVPPIRAACQARGIDRVDVVGRASGHVVAEPEALLPGYDVVFAKARAALEAMAVGCAVIVADAAGFGGLVTADRVESMRRLNFGVRTMQGTPVTADRVGAALDAYDPEASLYVSRWIRDHADFESALDSILAVYRELLADDAVLACGPDAVARAAASDYVAWLGRFVKAATMQRDEWLGSIDRLSTDVSRLGADVDRLDRDAAQAREAAALARNDAALAREEAQRLHDRLHATLSSRTWKAFSWYRRLRGGAT
jgi:hypothetical protein